jgi:hypothetical protein
MYNPGGRMKRLMNWLGVGIILVVGCERQLDPYYSDRPELQLEAVDIGCKDVMLRLTTSKAGTGGRLFLYENETLTDTIIYGGTDTILWRQNLQINTPYHWRLHWQDNPDQNSEEMATTLDTTSQNFTWEITEFGEDVSLVSDMTVISENDIWAVGELYDWNDDYSEYEKYNTAHWNGNAWEYLKTPFSVIYNGQVELDYDFRIRSVQWFDDGKILFTAGQNCTWFNSVDYAFNMDLSQQNLEYGPFYRIWGESSNDFYAVGSHGKIAHFRNDNWYPDYDNTNVHLYSISAHFNANVFACGDNDDKTELLHLSGEEWRVILTNTRDIWNYYQPGEIRGVYYGVQAFNLSSFLDCHLVWAL